MPIYEYRCNKCHHLMEVMHKISDPSPSTCENCNVQGSLEKQLSAPNFQLKGGGWYKDGYSSKKPESSDKKTDSEKTESSTSKSPADNKPADKSAGNKKSSTTAKSDKPD